MPRVKATVRRKWVTWENADVEIDIPQETIDAHKGNLDLAFWDAYYDFDETTVSWEETNSEDEYRGFAYSGEPEITNEKQDSS